MLEDSSRTPLNNINIMFRAADRMATFASSPRTRAAASKAITVDNITAIRQKGNCVNEYDIYT